MGDNLQNVDRDALAGFVPKTVKFFAAHYPESQPYKAPMRMPFQTVTLFADISGFTKTSVALMKFGPYGAEALADCLNQYMTLMIREVLSAGGDIIKFAGDAMIAMWPHPPDLMVPPKPMLPNLELFKNSESYRVKLIQTLGREVTEEDLLNPKIVKQMTDELEDRWQDEKTQKLEMQKSMLPTLCHRVVQCCCRIQDRFDLFDNTYIDVDVRLQVKLGVGCGRVDLLHLGGIFDRVEFLVCGAGLNQAFKCEADAIATKTIVSKEVWAKLLEAGANPEGHELGEQGNYEVDHVVATQRKALDKVVLSPTALKRVAGYVPQSVLPHLSIQGGDLWANELRECTILFVNLDYDLNNFNGDDKGESLMEVHNLIQTIQKAIYAFQGSLNKFISDDKGSTLVAVFGLFPVCHENDKARAVLAALRLKRDLDRESRNCWIGITSGMVFSGLCGHRQRQREFSVIGVYVNLAARLMAEAKKWKTKHKSFVGNPPNILVSDTVKKAAAGEPRLTFKTLQNVTSVKCKGFPDAIKIFRPKVLQNYEYKVRLGDDEQVQRAEVVSHFEKDIRRVKKRIMEMKHDGEGCVVMVEGGAGFGVDQFKRKLKEEIRVGIKESVESSGPLGTDGDKWTFISGSGDPFNRYPEASSTPVWEQVFEDLRDKKGYQMADRTLLGKFSEYVDMRRPDLADFKCLVTNTLHFPMSRDERAFKGVSEQREMTAGLDLLCLFLEMIAYTQPIVVMIYNIQCLQGWDWHLVRRLASLIRKHIISRVTLIVSCVPVDNPCYTPLYPDPNFVPEYKDFKNCLIDQDMIIQPKVWSLDNTREYIRNWITFTMGACRGEQLDVCDLIVNSVHERCGGRPGFCELFLNNLHEEDLFVQDRFSKRVKFKPEIERNLQNDSGGQVFVVPDKIKCLTITHFDRMSVEKLMILKIASVLCIGQGVGCLVFDREMLEQVHPIHQYVQRIDSDLRVLVELGYIHEVATQNSYGDDPPLLGGSPLFDYTEIMPDIEYLLQEPALEEVPWKHGKMKKSRASSDHGDIREFVFVNNVLYWWVPGMVKSGAKPHGSVRFDAKVIMNPEGRNPQLLYALGISLSQSRQSILVKTNRKVYDFLPPTTADMDEWFALFDQALNHHTSQEHNFSHIIGFRARAVAENQVDSYSRTRMEKKRSIMTLRDFADVYECLCLLPDNLKANECVFHLYPERSSPEDVIWKILEEQSDGRVDVENYHLLVDGCNWPLYGHASLLWDNKHVRLACTATGPKMAKFELVKSDPAERYARMPPPLTSHGTAAIEITVKLPLNQNQLREIKMPINLNETTVQNIIEHSLRRLVQKSSEIKRDSYVMSRNHAELSQDPNDWMLRLAGSDVHLFGEGLLAEFTAVREAFDEFGEISFQLLPIKADARKAMKSGFGSQEIFRFYAFSYGFMRDIIYRQMLHPHRVNLHGRCAKHLKIKTATDKTSMLQILQHRHDQISQRLFYR